MMGSVRENRIPGKRSLFNRETALADDIRFYLQEKFVIDRLLPLGVAVFLSLVIGVAVYRFTWMFAAGVVGAIAYAVICLRYPVLLLMLMTLIIPFQSKLPASLNLGGGLNPFNILLITLFGIWLLNGIMRRSLQPPKHVFGLVILLFAAVVIFSLVRASIVIPEYTLSDGMNWAKRWVLPSLIFFPLAFSNLDRRNLKMVLWGMVGVIFLMALVTLNDYRLASLSSFNWDVRPGGPFGKGAANDLAAFFVYYPSVLLGWLFFEKKWLNRIVLLGVLGASTFALLLTYSRGGYLGFLLALLTVAFLKKRSLLILLLLMGVSYRVWVPSGVEQRVEMTTHQLDEDGAEIVIPPNSFERNFEKSTADRLIIWRGALQMIRERPLLGFGFMNFQRYITRYAQIAKPMDAHNMYLRVAVEMGLPGLAIFLLIWIVPLVVTGKLYFTTDDPLFKGISLGMVAAIMGIMVVNIWGSRFFREELVGLYWMLMGIVARMDFLNEEVKSQ